MTWVQQKGRLWHLVNQGFTKFAAIHTFWSQCGFLLKPSRGKIFQQQELPASLSRVCWKCYSYYRRRVNK